MARFKQPEAPLPPNPLSPPQSPPQLQLPPNSMTARPQLLKALAIRCGAGDPGAWRREKRLRLPSHHDLDLSRHGCRSTSKGAQGRRPAQRPPTGAAGSNYRSNLKALEGLRSWLAPACRTACLLPPETLPLDPLGQHQLHHAPTAGCVAPAHPSRVGDRGSACTIGQNQGRCRPVGADREGSPRDKSASTSAFEVVLR